MREYDGEEQRDLEEEKKVIDKIIKVLYRITNLFSLVRFDRFNYYLFIYEEL